MEIYRLENYSTTKTEWSTDTYHKLFSSEKKCPKYIRHKRSKIIWRHWCGMPKIGSSIRLGSGFPGPRWGRLLGMTSDRTGHRLLPWRYVFTLSAAIVTSYSLDGLTHRLVIHRELQNNCNVFWCPFPAQLPSSALQVLLVPFFHARHWTYM